MKKVIIILVALSFLAVSAGLAMAAQKQAAPKATAPAKAPVVQALTDKQVADITTSTTETVNSKKWMVYLNTLRDKPGKPGTDVLTFAGATLTSQYLAAKGFKPSNCSIHVQPDESSVLETLMRDAMGGMAAWRIVLKGGNLGGTMTVWNKAGAVMEGYYFTMTPPAHVAAQAAETTAAAAATTTTTTTTTKK